MALTTAEIAFTLPEGTNTPQLTRLLERGSLVRLPDGRYAAPVPRGARTWTAADLAALGVGVCTGQSDATLADALRRTPAAIRRQRQALGWVVPRRVLDRDQMRALHAAGRTNPEIATSMNTSLHTVQQLLYEMKLRANPARKATP